MRIVTTPLIEEPTNPVHINPFRTAQDLAKFLNRRGWGIDTAMRENEITFTTGERGSQIYVVAKRG